MKPFIHVHLGTKTGQYIYAISDLVNIDPIWPNLWLALLICRHNMMTIWPHTTLLICVRWFWKWIIFIHTLQCRWKLFTSKTNVCNIQHSVVRFHIVCGHFVIILCLQIDRANLRFGQMAISEKHHRHRQLTYTNLGSSTSPSSDLKLYWWTLTPTQVFFRIMDDDAVWVQF